MHLALADDKNNNSLFAMAVAEWSKLPEEDKKAFTVSFHRDNPPTEQGLEADAGPSAADPNAADHMTSNPPAMDGSLTAMPSMGFNNLLTAADPNEVSEVSSLVGKAR